jgi:hypothetical protein
VYRLPLIVTLIAVQLATGSGSVYLCVGQHGGFCCLDFGPDYCICCRDEAEAPKPNDDSQTGCKSESCSCCHAKHAESPEPQESKHDDTIAASSACDCQHRLISIDRVVSRTHGRLVADFVQTANAVVIVCAAPLPDLSDRISTFDDGPPDLPDCARLSLSTVVIRC